MSLLERFNLFESVDLTQFHELYFNDSAIGRINHQYLSAMNDYPHIFTPIKEKRTVHFHPLFINSTITERNKQIAEFAQFLHETHIINNWRNELYGIYANGYLGENLLFTLERSAVSFLGLKAYGTHINGFTRDKTETLMWLAKRSITKSVEPLKLDQIAAGGLSFGETLLNNAIRECEEEASIPIEISKEMKPQGYIDYLVLENNFIRNDRLFCYDLELPRSFIPKVNDNEVDSFHLISTKKLLQQLQTTDDFKKNSALIMIHFLIRHEIINKKHSEWLNLRKKLNLIN